jgi:DNA-binding CsgD family transcriptional regulator
VNNKNKENNGLKTMNEYIDDFIMNKCPIGLVIFNGKAEIVYRNKKANTFLNRFELPPEITMICKRVLDAVDGDRLNESFPGEVYFTKRFDNSQSNWIFRFYARETPNPLVYLVIFEETVSNKLDMNGIRQQFRLTRRESDVLRRVLDGLTNIEIAEELEISEQTVKDHLSNIYMKMGVKNRAGVLRALIYSSNSN